jgi:hypothetical protein
MLGAKLAYTGERSEKNMYRFLKWSGTQATRLVLSLGWIVSTALLYAGVYGFSLLAPRAPSQGEVCLPAPCGDTPNPPTQFIFHPIDWASPVFQHAVWLLALALVIGLPVWIATVVRTHNSGKYPQLALMITSILASCLLIGDMAVAFLQASAVPNVPVCFGSATGTCFSGAIGALAAIVGFGWIPWLGAIVAGTPAWIMALLQTARWRQRNWFVAIFLLSPIAAALYEIFGADKPGHLQVTDEADKERGEALSEFIAREVASEQGRTTAPTR